KDARTGCAQRMAERNRAAIDVHLLSIEPELLLDGEVLRGKCFVDLEEIDVVERESVLLEQLADGRRRPHAHDARVDADGRPAAKARDWRHAVRLRARFR